MRIRDPFIRTLIALDVTIFGVVWLLELAAAMPLTVTTIVTLPALAVSVANLAVAVLQLVRWP